MKFLDGVGDPSYFPAALPDFVCHVSFRRYLPLSLEVVKKPNKRKRFLAPNFLGVGTTQNVLRQIVSTIYVHRLAKFG